MEKIFSIVEIRVDTLALAISIVALIPTILSYLKTNQLNRSNETQKVYDDWFSIKFLNLRKEYPIIINKIKSYENWQEKKFDEMISDDEINVLMTIIYFFDKVGWLALAGLINTDYILAPMHKWVVKVWNDLEPAIKAKRKFDNINSRGFEELAKYANKTPLEKLIKRIFPKKITIQKKLLFWR